MNRFHLALRRAAAALLGLTLAVSMGSALASCAIINTPAMLSGKLTVVGSASTSSIGRHLHASPLTAQFAFKCDIDTTYNMLVGDGVGIPTAMLRDTSGNQIIAAITLRSIDAKSINLDFSKMPVTGYLDRAIGGKVYQALLEVTPIDTALANNRGIAKAFTGNLKISLQY